MSAIKEKAAYLRGLLEGLDFSENSREKVLWEGLINFCGEIADEMEALEENQNEFAEYIEAVDEDLSVLEKYFYNNADESDSDEVVFTNDCGCGCKDEESVIELECPRCQEELYFTDETGDYEVVCPECGEVVWTHTVESDSAENHDVL